MPFKEPALALRDIAEAIAAIKQFTLNMNAASFRADAKTVAPVERKLQVISEAATRLGDRAEVLCPGSSLAQHPRPRQLATAAI